MNALMKSAHHKVECQTNTCSLNSKMCMKLSELVFDEIYASGTTKQTLTYLPGNANAETYEMQFTLPLGAEAHPQSSEDP